MDDLINAARECGTMQDYALLGLALIRPDLVPAIRAVYTDGMDAATPELLDALPVNWDI